jgi:hypothetical protein
VVPEAVNVQVTGEPDVGVAVTVIRAPEVKPVRSNVGVSIFVILSGFFNLYDILSVCKVWHKFDK